jgi:predicted nicotinamide N-methyase
MRNDLTTSACGSTSDDARDRAMTAIDRAAREPAFSPEALCVLGGALGVRALPLCPELRLWLLHDGVDLNARAEELLRAGPAPYWAFCWGAGQGLARYVLDHPELVAGRDVVDFGAGCGVAAIAAARAGARSATAVDIDELALRVACENARVNGVTLATARTLPARWDVLLASDVLYETGNEGLIESAARSGRELLLSDPLRHGTPRIGLEPVHEYEVRTLPDVDYPVQRAVIHRVARAQETAAR